MWPQNARILNCAVPNTASRLVLEAPDGGIVCAASRAESESTKLLRAPPMARNGHPNNHATLVLGERERERERERE
eukprot:6851956-Alexandrium_andersonii.AAC.1